MDWITFVEKLESFLTKVKDWGVWGYICRIPDMICRPRRFWQDYKDLTTKAKIIQFFTYGALFALAIWIVSYESLSIADLSKIVTMEVVSLFVYVIILSLANMIVSKEWKGLWFYIVFCCYTKFICIIPEILVLKIYYETETPLWIGVAALIPVLVELLILVYPAYIRQNTKGKMALAILLSVVFLNIYDGIFIITGFPRAANSNFENKIAKERFELGKSIKNAYDIPTYVVTKDNSANEWYLYSNPTDTVASLKFEDKEKYFADLAEDLDSLKIISGRSRFKTNKAFFDEMFILKKQVQYVHETKMYEHSPIIDHKDIILDSIIRYRIYYREFSKELAEKNVELLTQEIEESEQFNKAFSANALGALWHPVLFIWRFYDKKG